MSARLSCLSDNVVFCYKQGAEYAPAPEVGVRWEDPEIGIERPAGMDFIVSAKDGANGSFCAAVERLAQR